MTVVGFFYSTPSKFHPYECDGPGKCVHCDHVLIGSHDPATCDLCDLEYDGREEPE